MGKLDPDFLTKIVLVAGFRARRIESLQIALLLIGVQGIEFSAQDIASMTAGDIHLPGCACGSLLAMGLIEARGRVPSPDKKAHGRKLNLFRVPAEKIPTAKTWLERHGVTEIPQYQGQLTLGLAV